MTQYRFPYQQQQVTPQSVQEAKARRQAVLQRVRAQRAQAAKRTVTEWMQDGTIIRASELKERYQHKRSVVEQ